MATELNIEVALDQFAERYRENQGKQVDNSSMPAGSPMVYYCRHCGVHTETLPESHWGRPKTVCNPCKVLDDHGLIPKAVERTKASQYTIIQLEAEPHALPEATKKEQQPS
jgi:hypothetical protein